MKYIVVLDYWDGDDPAIRVFRSKRDARDCAMIDGDVEDARLYKFGADGETTLIDSFRAPDGDFAGGWRDAWREYLRGIGKYAESALPPGALE